MPNNVFQGEKYRFTLLNAHVIRLEYAEKGEFVNLASQCVLNRQPATTYKQVATVAGQAVVSDKQTITSDRQPEKSNMQEAATEFSYKETDTQLEISTKYFHLYYLKEQAFSAQSLYVDFKFNYAVHRSRWYYGDKIETLGGTIETIDELNGSADLGDGLISYYGYSVLDDSNTALIAPNGEIVARPKEHKDLYIFAYGHDYLAAIQFFYELAGHTPLLPRYALGNFWSRYWPYTTESYQALIDKFNDYGIPFSVAIIDMDWHTTNIPSRFGSGWTGYTWNKKLIPEPTKLLNYLHQKGLAVALNDHPAAGIRASEEQYLKVAERLHLDATKEEAAVFNFNSKDYREAFFAEIYRPLEKQGVDFWWIDWQQGNVSSIPGLTPLWLLNHYNYVDIKEQGKDPLILSRYAGPGSHRYPIGFSGDSIVSWESLDFQPYMTATSSNIGYTWWSHDIGGHMHGVQDKELTLRWLQFGIFSPINRLHSSNSPFFRKEPFNYDKETQDTMIKFLRLRHELVPYLYTANYLTAKEGEPLILPLYYKQQDEYRAYQYKNTYYFGSELLVAPITSPSDKATHLAKVKTYLPKGSWFDIFTNDYYEGDVEISLFRDSSTIPVFAKAGAIIPTEPFAKENSLFELPKVIEWQIYPGASNTYKLIETKVQKKVRADEESADKGSVGKGLANNENEASKDKVRADEACASKKKADKESSVSDVAYTSEAANECDVAYTIAKYDYDKGEFSIEVHDPLHILPKDRQHYFTFNACNEFAVRTLPNSTEASVPIASEANYQAKESLDTPVTSRKSVPIACEASVPIADHASMPSALAKSSLSVPGTDKGSLSSIDNSVPVVDKESLSGVDIDSVPSVDIASVSATYDANKQRLKVGPFNNNDMTIDVSKLERKKLTVLTDKVFDLLANAEIAYDTKTDIYNYFGRERNAKKLAQYVQNIENASLKAALQELLYVYEE